MSSRHWRVLSVGTSTQILIWLSKNWLITISMAWVMWNELYFVPRWESRHKCRQNMLIKVCWQNYFRVTKKLWWYGMGKHFTIKHLVSSLAKLLIQPLLEIHSAGDYFSYFLFTIPSGPDSYKKFGQFWVDRGLVLIKIWFKVKIFYTKQLNAVITAPVKLSNVVDVHFQHGADTLAGRMVVPI